MSDGLVIAAHGQRGWLEAADGRRRAFLLRGRRLRAVCGDRVHFSEPDDAEGPVLVEGVAPRDNALERLPPRSPQPEILAANLTVLAVVVAPEPAPDWFVTDRYLCAAALMRATGHLVVNKCDLADIDAAELTVYRAIGYPVHEVSARTGAGMASLAAALRGETAALVGQSGVGKSSLVNLLVPGADLATGVLSERSAEGTHTTTAAVMLSLPGGGRLVDSPGVRDFVPWIGDAAAVQHGFVEIAARAADCRFADCRHLREPGCAVKAAVEAGSIAARRYESYRRMLRNVAPVR